MSMTSIADAALAFSFLAINPLPNGLDARLESRAPGSKPSTANFTFGIENVSLNIRVTGISLYIMASPPIGSTSTTDPHITLNGEPVTVGTPITVDVKDANGEFITLEPLDVTTVTLPVVVNTSNTQTPAGLYVFVAGATCTATAILPSIPAGTVAPLGGGGGFVIQVSKD
jgi:hypothetical protein